MPLVLANAFNINLNIFNEAHDHSYEVKTITPCNHTNISVDIHRQGDHCNGLIPSAGPTEKTRQAWTKCEIEQTIDVNKDVIRYTLEYLRSLRHHAHIIKCEVRKMLFHVQIWKTVAIRNYEVYSPFHHSSRISLILPEPLNPMINYITVTPTRGPPPKVISQTLWHLAI